MPGSKLERKRSHQALLARVLLVAQRYGISPSLVYRWRREAAG